MISAIYFVVWIVAWGGIVQGLSGPRVGLRACITASRRSWLSIARLGLMGRWRGLAVICDASSVAARRGPSRARLGPERTREFRRSSRPCRNIRAGYVDRLDGARLRAHRSGTQSASRREDRRKERDHHVAGSPLAGDHAVDGQCRCAGLAPGRLRRHEFVPGGSAPRVGRIILLGQMFILARIVLRLWNTGAQVSLYQRTSGQPSPTR